MEFFSEFDRKFIAQIFLLYDVKNSRLLEEYKIKDNACLLNPEIILDITHLSIAIERAVMKKKSIKKDIIYYSLESGKLDTCYSEHTNYDQKEKCFLILINPITLLLKEDVEKMFDCKTLEAGNFSYFSNISKIKKLFNVNDLYNNKEFVHSGLSGQIYNILSLKDLR